MKEIKCPKCGEVFAVDESGYAQIVQQVRDKEFDKELKQREKDLEEIKKKVESEQKRNTCISETGGIMDVGIEDFAINLEEVNEAERRKVIEKINRLYKIIEGGKEGGREE